MPYQINKFNGDPLLVLEDGTLDSTTDLGLVGKNFAGYGEIQNENFLWLLENFAGESAPSKPLVGQLWYDSAEDRVKVYSNSDWDIIGNTKLSTTEPADPQDGDMYLNTVTDKFYVYNGDEWTFIGPESVVGFPNTRLISTRIKQKDTSNFYPIVKVSLNDTVVAIFAERQFEIDPTEAIIGFTTLRKGLTFSTTSAITSDLTGNASSATVLQTSRNINGVAFNGSANITIQAVSPNSIIAGTHLSGSSYNGSSDITWSVVANSSNVDDTIVKRDSNGNFYAGTIYSDLVGTVTGTTGITVYGDVEGNLIGNVTGNLTGNVTGNLTGNVTGNVAGNVTGNVAGNVIGNLTGDVIGNVVGGLQGNATTANRLTTPRNINGVAFDGSSNITILDSTKLPINGGTLTGFLTLSAAPTQNLHAATKKYVDDGLNNLELVTEEFVLDEIANTQRVKAWVRFNGSTGSIISSFRVSSVSRTGNGAYTINITPGTFSNANIAAAGMASDTDHFVTFRSSTSTTLLVFTVDNGSGNNAPSTTSGNVMVIMVG